MNVTAFGSPALNVSDTVLWAEVLETTGRKEGESRLASGCQLS